MNTNQTELWKPVAVALFCLALIGGIIIFRPKLDHDPLPPSSAGPEASDWAPDSTSLRMELEALELRYDEPTRREIFTAAMQAQFQAMHEAGMLEPRDSEGTQTPAQFAEFNRLDAAYKQDICRQYDITETQLLFVISEGANSEWEFEFIEPVEPEDGTEPEEVIELESEPEPATDD